MNLYAWMDCGESNIERGGGGGGVGGRGDDKQRPKHTKLNKCADVNNRDPLSLALLSNLPKKIGR